MSQLAYPVEESPVLKERIVRIAVLLFAKLFRAFPNGRRKIGIKERIFDRYFGWRRLTVSTKTVFGATMDVHLPDSIQTQIFLTGVWEPCVTRLISESLRPGEIFVDVGANVGYYSLLAARRVGPMGHVYAFEASPTVFSALQRNIRRNRLENVTILNVAVSDGPGTCSIWAAPDSNLGHSTIMPNVAQADGHRHEATVRCDALPALLPLDHLLRARFIKIDVEGAEQLVVRGIAHLLKQFSCRTEWLLELSPCFSPGGHADVEWIFSCFVNAGYRAFQIANAYSNEFVFSDTRGNDLSPLAEAPDSRLTDVLFSQSRT
jgi:FkbM family methyltransferase